MPRTNKSILKRYNVKGLSNLLQSYFFNNMSKKCDFKININGFNIEQSESIKYLGVVLDEKLNWKAHLRSLKSKLSQSCFV